jgi:general secretion pathway protein D
VAAPTQHPVATPTQPAAQPAAQSQLSAVTITPMEQPTPAPRPLDIEATIERGIQAYNDGQLDEAQNSFDAVLHNDAYNQTAIRWLKRIADKKAGREEQSYTTTRTRMLENVQAAWNTPKANGKNPEGDTATREPTAEELRTQALRTKLETIQFPSIAFQNADIQQVVAELSALCRKLDDAGKGVNLVVFGASETLLPAVTFSGTDLSALETLDIITQMAGMKYDIGPSMVSLTPVNYEPPQQMASVEFDVMPAVGAKMALMTDSTIATAGLLDVRSFFSTVAFPQGSSAQFNPEFNLLLVHNVPKHILGVEALLERYNRKARAELSQQVEIETKFIEVAEGALDELGFEWTLGETGSTLTSDGITMAGGQKLFTDTLRTGSEAFRSSIGAAGTASAFNTYAGAVSSMADDITGSASELILEKVNGIPVELIIRALERQEGSDLLSAPRVLAKSGETASIHVGEIRSFPTAYDVIIERYAQPSLLPLDYQEYKTGVILEVTPQLDPENHTIDLKLSPEIKELVGFDEQHTATVWPEFGDESLDMDAASAGSELLDFLTAREENRTINADRLIARMPVFKSRKVETAVTIEDGSTIVMGGLIKEKVETFKDSVPVLGKIPLLGRLFRSEGERTVKRNLLIFVTASQVDAAGYKNSAE